MSKYELVMPFGIDGDEYTDRDRLMFACGNEFQMVFNAIRNGDAWFGLIHRENLVRVIDMCNQLGSYYLNWPDDGTAMVQVSIHKRNNSGLPAHAVCFFKDGDKWCCVNGDFTNLQESPAGFGETFEDAFNGLKQVRSLIEIDEKIRELNRTTAE